MASGPSQSEMLSNLILKWYETQKSQSNNNNEVRSHLFCVSHFNLYSIFVQRPDIDVINITWILKALGFNLDFMDFLPDSISGDKLKEINIEVKCSVSGLVARLNYKLEGCACPKKKDEQTFWEVQGMAPSSKTQVKQKDTSSSLLPEMSANCSLVSKAILNNLLKYYKDCIEEKGTEQPSEAIKKIKIPEMFASNQVKSDDVPALKNTEVVKQKIAIPEITVMAEPTSQALTEENNKSPSDSFMESINTDTVNIATSSPNEIFDEQSNRDANVVQALNEARSKINQALLYMRLNVTQDLSMASSTILMTTPKGLPPKRVPPVGTPGSLKRSATASDITQHKASAQKEKQKSNVSRKSCLSYLDGQINYICLNLHVLQVEVVLDSSQ